MMNDIFHDFIMEGVVCVYLDDILIFTKSLAEGWRVVWQVMEQLHGYKLYLQPEKCECEWLESGYLGLIVSEGEVRMDPIKVSRFMEWLTPRYKQEVQSFLGFMSFYLSGDNHLFHQSPWSSLWSTPWSNSMVWTLTSPNIGVLASVFREVHG